MAKVEDELLATAAPQKSAKVVGPSEPEKGGFHPLLELTLARVREFVRQPEALFWVFGFPVLLAFALGIAFRNQGPQKLRVAVESGPPEAQAAANALARDDGLELLLLSPADAALALRTGKVALVIRALPPQSSGPSYDYRYDPTRPESKLARMSVDDALERAAGRADLAKTRDETVTEPGARYIDFLIPGLIGMNLMGSGLWGLGFAIVMARSKKLLKRLAATPMRRYHFLLSYMLSRLVFLALEVAAVLGFAWLLFRVTVRGSWFDVAVVSLIGSLAFAGLGLLISSRTKTIEGVSGLMNLIMLPMWVLSGTFFSASRFPNFLQPAIKALPLTALNDALRAVINDGASLVSTWRSLLVLCAWGLTSFLVALKIFRWQ
jgi:ABC-type multidrug transport system permease subunit